MGETLGVSGPAIYRHFKNKDQLLFSVYLAVGEAWERAISGSEEVEEAGARFRSTLEGFFEYAVTFPALYQVLTAPPAIFREAGVEATHRQVLTSTHRIFTERLEACVSVGLFQVRDPADTALTFWAALHGIMTLYRPSPTWTTSEREDFQRFFQRSVARFIAGFG